MNVELSNHQLFFFLFIAFFFSAFFSAAEASFLTLTRVEVNRLVRSNFFLSNLPLFLYHRFKKFMLVALACNMASNIIATLLASEYFRREGKDYLETALPLESPISDILFVGGFTLFILIFAEFIPKQIAIYFPRFISYVVSPVILLFYFFFFPLFLVWQKIFVKWFPFLSLESRAMEKEVGEKNENDKKPSPHSSVDFNYQELRGYISLGAQTGALKKLEGDLLERVINYMNIPVTSFLVTRDRIQGIDISLKKKKNILAEIKKFPHQQIPLYKHSKDNIVAILSKKQLATMNESEINTLEKIESLAEKNHKPIVIPESKNTINVLRDIYASRCDAAIVTDEYGGNEGLVFYSDIVSRLLGNNEDGEQVQEKIRRINKNTALVDASLSIREVNRYFSTTIECQQAETLGGYLLEKLQRIPKKNFSFSDEFFFYTIKNASARKIEQVLLERKKK